MSSEYDEDAIKVKVGCRSRAMSAPWCWTVVCVNHHEIPKQIVSVPARLKLEDIAKAESLMPHEQHLDRIFEHVPKMAEHVCAVPVPQVLEKIVEVVRSRVELPVSQIYEATVEVVSFVPKERVQQRIDVQRAVCVQGTELGSFGR